MKFADVIPKLVEAVEIQPGDVVLVQLWGEDDSLPLLKKFSLEIAKAGGIPIQWQFSRKYIGEYFSTVSEDYLAFPDHYFKIYEPVDVVIDLLSYSPAPKGIEPEKISFYGQYMQKLFQTLMTKRAFIQVKVPTVENATTAGVQAELFEDVIIRALDIDYSQIKKEADALLARLTGTEQVEIYTGVDQKLSFQLQQRKWYKDDGVGDLPCGEVYIAPVEETGQGQLFLPQIFLEGKSYSDVTLIFEKGTLVSSTPPEVLEFVQSFPGDADRLAKFGIGLNPGVRELIGYPGTDEKMGGTIHIAVGMNAMFGGQNQSPLHLDLICQPEKVLIDGKVLIEAGKIR